MKVVVTGATGLIGSAICARLVADGHSVIAATRNPDAHASPDVMRWIRLDFGSPDRAAWTEMLAGADVVVNCVGVLQDNAREDTAAAHARGAEVLFDACVEAGVRRIVHFSAVGVDRHQASAFSRTKLAGDRALMTKPIEWVVLRPAVVLGRSVFGASALFRGLSALPLLPVMPDTGRLQVVSLDDVVETVVRLLPARAPSRVSLELVGPEALTMSEVVARYRAWHGWKPARTYRLSGTSAVLLYKAGDLAARLGWRPPVRSTARREMVHGATGDPAAWERFTGLKPKTLGAMLAASPASVQDRWFAKLYILKPVLFAVLAMFWLATGIISLTIGLSVGIDLMIRAGAGNLAMPSVIAGAIADIIIGLLIAWRPTTRVGLWSAIGLSCFYIIAGTILLPVLWREPLGPLLKIWPIMTAHFAALAILDER